MRDPLTSVPIYLPTLSALNQISDILLCNIINWRINIQVLKTLRKLSKNFLKLLLNKTSTPKFAFQISSTADISTSTSCSVNSPHKNSALLCQTSLQLFAPSPRFERHLSLPSSVIGVVFGGSCYRLHYLLPALTPAIHSDGAIEKFFVQSAHFVKDENKKEIYGHKLFLYRVT